jgi:enamine deaminase RidA (YjgF/YER057c/UK114 family)
MREVINPKGVFPANYDYAVKAGGILWIAGQLALDEGGKIVSADPGKQAKQCLDNLERVLTAAGASLKNVVFVRTFVTHWAIRDAVKAEIQARFGEKRPPSTTLVVVSLGYPESVVEIEATAVVDG